MPSIQEAMTKDPVQVGQEATIQEVAALMRDHDIGDVLVTSDEGSLVGIATDRDIVVRCLAEGYGPDSPVGSACTTDPITLTLSDKAGDAVKTMREHAIRRVPVVDGGRPVGIVSIGDLATEYDSDSALADISKAPPDS